MEEEFDWIVYTSSRTLSLCHRNNTDYARIQHCKKNLGFPRMNLRSPVQMPLSKLKSEKNPIVTGKIAGTKLLKVR